MADYGQTFQIEVLFFHRCIHAGTASAGNDDGTRGRLKRMFAMEFEPDAHVAAMAAELDGRLVGALTYLDSPGCSTMSAGRALRFLRMALERGAEAPPYVEGLIAFYEGRPADAVVRARVAAAEVPWLYEAKELVGDILRRLGRDGDDPKSGIVPFGCLVQFGHRQHRQVRHALPHGRVHHAPLPLPACR